MSQLLQQRELQHSYYYVIDISYICLWITNLCEVLSANKKEKNG